MYLNDDEGDMNMMIILVVATVHQEELLVPLSDEVEVEVDIWKLDKTVVGKVGSYDRLEKVELLK